MNAFTICGKELNTYFRSPIAYGVMAFFAFIAGYFFYAGTVIFITQSMQTAMAGQQVPMNVNDWVIRNVLANLGVVFLLLIPLITMRLFAEEKRTGTIELLVTSPLRDWEVILGKWMAAMVLFVCLLGISLVNMLTLFAYGNPDWRPMAVGYLGVLLQGGALLALGTFISSTTKNQIVAGVATFATGLLLWVLDWVSSVNSGPVFSFLPFFTYDGIAYLSFVQHFEPFGRGVIELKDVLFFLSVTVFGLFLTARSLESMRWRA